MVHEPEHHGDAASQEAGSRNDPVPATDPAPGEAASAGHLEPGAATERSGEAERVGGASTAEPEPGGTAGAAEPTRERGTVPAVRARELTKVYGTGPAAVRALNHVDVDFAAGEFTAIMGPSGSGKSTLLHLLAGLDAATAGTVHVGDTEITALGDDALTVLRRDRLGFVFQSFNLLPVFTAEQNILLPLELAGRTVDPQWYEQLIGTLSLGERLTHRPGELSGGQQQRVAIARALIAHPEVVFADEPTGNLDSRSGAEVLSFLRRSVRELGRTVVMVTHDPTAAAYADRVVLLADGAIAGSIDEPTPESVLAGLDALRMLESPLADAAVA